MANSMWFDNTPIFQLGRKVTVELSITLFSFSLYFRAVPDVLSFYSFMFYFHGIMCGPLSFYSDYMAFIDGSYLHTPPPQVCNFENVSVVCCMTYSRIKWNSVNNILFLDFVIFPFLSVCFCFLVWILEFYWIAFCV